MFKIKIEEHGYGFFPGGDPRRFTPDSDARPEELENHRKACEAWERGEQNSRPDCAHGPGFVVTTCQFGLGSYTYEEELGPWEWARYVAWPRLCNRLWWWWNLDVDAWLVARGWRKDRRGLVDTEFK